ncbi:MAG: type II toxin-antitoxin system PemK/MazF family toxin [Actinobacteria bacterium]|nr:type II toxin-antitoxin system PemK/MazF family toxin [Actinomycetota bacterium]
MKIKKWEVWIANLDPRIGTEPGKTRPVVIIQTDLLNGIHPSTIVCPITSNIEPESDILRVHLGHKEAGLKKSSDILVDQLRAIDNRRLIERLGVVSDQSKEKLIQNISIILDIGI